MDEQYIPIDINNNKLLEWLISRRHVPKEWQSSIIKVREKINGAIQDMPAHEGIIELLTGQHINYFHCLKIVDILKKTEADSKNIFGRYGSQRMRDWQDIIGQYQKDSIYLAEAAQILIRNVSYEIPSLRKQIQRLEQSHLEAEKKINEYTKSETSALKEFNSACEQLGIAAGKDKDIRTELLHLVVAELPKIHANIADKLKLVKPVVDLYLAFHRYVMNRSATNNDHDVDNDDDQNQSLVPTLRFVIEHGDTTTYHYIYHEKPLKIELEEEPNEVVVVDDASAEGRQIEVVDEIDFGDDLEAAGRAVEEEIDWGGGDTTPSTDDGFEIVSTDEILLEESGIVVEQTGHEGGVARGTEALTLLDNPATLLDIITDLTELDAFLQMRLYETSAIDANQSLIALDNNIGGEALVQTIESLVALSDCVKVALGELTNKRAQHLHSVKHSPKYVDSLAANLHHKLAHAQRVRQCSAVLGEQMNGFRSEMSDVDRSVKVLIERTKQLQRAVEADISKRYKGRVVNIVGGAGSF